MPALSYIEMVICSFALGLHSEACATNYGYATMHHFNRMIEQSSRNIGVM
jgi:hypothetical protein